jgi:pyruvate dehydrogenase E2 component (dihydrolipoamide acetyltransferase)
MPSLGADMEEGTLLEWRVAPGDRIERGQVVALVDTDKAEIEIEAFHPGTVEALLVMPGQTVPVGAPLARLANGASAREGAARSADGREGAARSADGREGAARSADGREGAARSADGREGAARSADGREGAARSADRDAPEPPPVPARAGPPPPALAPGERVRATPLARRTAAELGVDLAALARAGAGEAITRADVERAAHGAPAPAVAPAGERPRSPRAPIASAMARSKREIPHYYLGCHIDVSAALGWLERHNAGRPAGARVLPAALLLKAVALAVRAVPVLNGFWRDDRFEPAAEVNLGVAISLRGGGLVAPALRGANSLGIDELMQALRDLVARARRGVLRSSEVSGATLTVTSLGEQGVETVFGVIHPPQVALVGLGAILERAWARDGWVGAHKVVHATLSGDHRASDGHDGARFLARLDELLQRPEDW